jgi:hypothetical protein
MGKVRDFVARKLPVTKVRRGRWLKSTNRVSMEDRRGDEQMR